jgi:eukaryotic-like serine/threonine-protein kinase
MTPVLDELLYADEAGCAARLAEIRTRDARLADEIGHFLAQRAGAETDDFLDGHALDLVVDASAGEAVGSYTLERALGQGGMGTVWLARRSHGRYEGHVAVKFLDAPRFERGGIERFRREGSVLARLAHPNIARLIDAGVTSAANRISCSSTWMASRSTNGVTRASLARASGCGCFARYSPLSRMRTASLCCIAT